jgi:stage V sporulation protein R
MKKNNKLTLEHVFDGRELDLIYAKETLKYMKDLWRHEVSLLTKTKDGTEFMINCQEDSKITITDCNRS